MYLRFESGGMAVDWDLLEGVLNRYGAERKPILDDWDLRRVLVRL
jgi:hypothetical protein